MSTHAADTDVNVNTQLDVLQRENEDLRTELALIQSPGEILDTQIMTGVFVYHLWMHIA